MKVCSLSMFQNKRIMFFSPHHDDAVLSCGGLLRQLSVLCDEIHIVNVFTKSLWAPNCSQYKSMEEISSRRAKENDAYCDALHLKNTNLGFEDSMVRGYDDYEELNTDYRKDSIHVDAAKLIGRVMNQGTYDLYFCPLALGNHVDHQIVKYGVLSNPMRDTSYIIFYEDLPYASLIEEEMGQIEYELSKTLHSLEFEFSAIEQKKRQDIMIYHSQLEENLIDNALNYAKRFQQSEYHERIWIDSSRRFT